MPAKAKETESSDQRHKEAGRNEKGIKNIMANIYKGTLGLIGGTPLVEVVNIEKELGLEATVLAKLEYFNPAGSVKDRIAKAMIEDAEEKGLLKEGHTERNWCSRMARRA